MPLFDPPIAPVRAAVAVALAEDLVPLGDLTSALLPDGARADGLLVARQAGVVAGRACVDETFAQVDPAITCRWHVDDGDRVEPGSVLAIVGGPLASVLTAERTALNFLGHLSGIATLTGAFVQAAGGRLRVWDTRKTTPGLRALEKAAVRAGGAVNHRGNLSDWVMFKDNHLTVLGIDEAVRRARDVWPGRTVHVEADGLDQVREALEAGADAILLDNMSPDEVRAAVELADAHARRAGTRRALLEISGGITLDTIGRYADCGADVVSSGAITNSAPVLDIGLDINVV
ncbi:MAG: nicotinate-nucleotide pyrophosphorylase (carboxylating) [Acidimicrobiales bacterium]|nr:nicotinate-nucleotide pyrophosphorylase (carboxylating) [Acidimicrobiales bacterium]